MIGDSPSGEICDQGGSAVHGKNIPQLCIAQLKNFKKCWAEKSGDVEGQAENYFTGENKR